MGKTNKREKASVRRAEPPDPGATVKFWSNSDDDNQSSRGEYYESGSRTTRNMKLGKKSREKRLRERSRGAGHYLEDSSEKENSLANTSSSKKGKGSRKQKAKSGTRTADVKGVTHQEDVLGDHLSVGDAAVDSNAQPVNVDFGDDNIPKQVSPIPINVIYPNELNAVHEKALNDMVGNNGVINDHVNPNMCGINTNPMENLSTGDSIFSHNDKLDLGVNFELNAQTQSNCNTLNTGDNLDDTATSYSNYAPNETQSQDHTLADPPATPTPDAHTLKPPSMQTSKP